MATKKETRIRAQDFDGFVSKIAADIWNRLLDTPTFRGLKPGHFADLYEILSRNLAVYRSMDAKRAGSRESRGRALPR